MIPRRSPSSERTERPARRAPFPVDVEDRGDEYVVTADLPGLRTQDVDVRVRKRKLQIEADFGDEAASPKYRRKERRRGDRNRVVTFPDPVDESRVSATYQAGVLQVRAPKRRRSKRVPVE
jgi:HSP20 family protein